MRALHIRSWLIGAVLFPCAVQAQHPAIQDIIDSVSVDSMVAFVEHLSGEVPVDVGNGPELILSRHKLNAGNAVAAQYMLQKLSSWGYSPVVQSFSTTGENLLVTIPGTLYPGRKVVLCAHYDAMPGGIANAPAADDDGSGTAAVLEAARILAGRSFENTIVLALWDEEEQGKVGSQYYASAAAGNDDTLIAVINMDAIAWDGNADGLMRIHARAVGNSLDIKDTAVMVNSTYGLNINMAINTPGATYSDHASFWTEGYGAILVIEDFDNDGNPHYHTQTDLVQYFDLPYFEKIARLSIATAAVWAVPVSGSTALAEFPDPVQGFSAYPVPTNGMSTVHLRLRSEAMVQLVVYDATGRVVNEPHTGMRSAGEHRVEIDLSRSPCGIYWVKALIDGGHSRTLRLVRIP